MVTLDPVKAEMFVFLGLMHLMQMQHVTHFIEERHECFAAADVTNNFVFQVSVS